MPYRLTDKPYVNYWFPDRRMATASIGSRSFSRRRTSIAWSRRAASAWSTLTSAPAASTRAAASTRDSKHRIKDLAARNGWFAPASEILDYLRKQDGWEADMGYKERLRLEATFFGGRVLRPRTRRKS